MLPDLHANCLTTGGALHLKPAVPETLLRVARLLLNDPRVTNIHNDVKGGRVADGEMFA